jgi:hypothetical protein
MNNNNCFLCLEPAKYLKCPGNRCKMKAHKKCWEQYTQMFTNCPCCRYTVIPTNARRYNTRSTALKTDSVQEIVDRIVVFISANRLSESFSAQAQAIIDLVNFLRVNKWFLHRYRNCSKGIKVMLRRLYHDKKWSVAEKLYRKLFNENI